LHNLVRNVLILICLLKMTSLTAPKSISDDASPLLTQLSLHDLSPSVSSSLPSASDGTLSPERGVPPVRPPKSPSRRSSSQDVKANGSELDKGTARDPAYVMRTYESRQTLIGLQKDAGESRRLVS